MDDQNASMYPPIPDAAGLMPQAYPMPPMQMPQQLLPQQLAPQQVVPPQSMGQQFRTSDSPASEPSRASVQASSKAGQQPKKNQYPCPMAKQVGCTDFFTTSGHAARHAKKHTGKKDAFCPECNKAFTRKDNMEQHRRTHQNGRGASRASNDDSKVKKPAKQPAKKTTAKPEPHLEMALEQQLAEQAQQVQTVAQAVQEQDIQQAVTQQALADAMLVPAAGPYFLGGIDTGPIPALPMPLADMSIRPPLHRSSFANSLDFVPPVAPMVDPDTLHYSYPSPNGLTNGLNSLALAASEHSRRSEHASSPSDSAQQTRSPSIETPQRETP
ncbi:unnamed protein product [Zymoseptoria tritici ST99CH_1A5]|uniref:C2H2-type domain-containing protein n=1 Tax=Zymoseptoria tritici ST99CH_1A5 TaxID=1276529 RepID=A0A1Y6L4J1_ZYMTR|nr:unnamed protein product [Zymoseptoria tritici ST99CH_1A5]